MLKVFFCDNCGYKVTELQTRYWRQRSARASLPNCFRN